MSIVNWFASHWATILSVLGAIVVVATVLNSALPYAPRGKGALEWLKWICRLVVDIAAARAQRGAVGVADTRWSVPFVTVSKPNGVSSGDGGAGAAIVLLAAGAAFALALAGCGGWEANAYRGAGLVARAGAGIVEILPGRCDAAQQRAIRAPEVANLPTVAERNAAGHRAVERVAAQCAQAAKGLDVVQGGVKLGIDGIDDARKLREAPRDQLQWLRAAFHAWQDLAPILKALGVDVPSIPLPEVP